MIAEDVCMMENDQKINANSTEFMKITPDLQTRMKKDSPNKS